MRSEQLVTMVNEIAAFFQGADSETKGAENVENHLRRYWDPRMRKQIIEYASKQGEGLAPLAKAGIDLLARSAPTRSTQG